MKSTSAQLRVVQVIQGVFNPSAGPTYSVAKIADELYARGVDSVVAAIGAPPANWPYRVPLERYDGPLVRKTGTSLKLWSDLRTESHQPCILHGHGIWRASNLFPLFVPASSPARMVISPRGMLSEWGLGHKRWRKLPFWHGLQRPALMRAHAFHATAPLEYDDIRRAGFSQPVFVIPNGVEIPDLPTMQKQKRLVFLSRIDPKKGLDMLIPAWAQLAPEFPEWELVIAGPLGSDFAGTMQKLAASSGAPRVQFLGEVRGAEKLALLAGAALFVLPTYSENFGIAIAEAMAHGTAVITTTATPWTDLPRKNAGWCVQAEFDAMLATLRAGLLTPLSALEAMGVNGRAWMQAEFGWARIGEQMHEAYLALLHGSAYPSWVIQH